MATLGHLLGRSSEAASEPFLYAKAYCGVSPGVGDELYVVRSAVSSPPAGVVLTDADDDGFLVAENSQGLVPPLFTSESGNSAVGHPLFTPHFFAYASTTVDSAASVLVTSGDHQEWVPLVAPGVADITAAWAGLDDGSASFTVEWLDSSGAAVDQLSGQFLGVVN